ncbi:MAG TPA: CHAD domain-containing protein [Sphingomicrobium sp.]
MDEIEFKLEVGRITGEIPVKPCVRSKPERGFALAESRFPEPAKAEPVPVRKGMSVAEGFETIVANCLRHFQANEPLVIESRDARALHQARVAMRRLRSALALFRPVISDRQFARIRHELRWLGAELGGARNLDMYLERDLGADQRQFVEERREKAYDLAIAALKSARSMRLMLELVDWSASGSWRSGRRAGARLQPFVARRVDRLWSKIAKSDGVSDLTDRQRHRLRIKTKKLRYALAFFDALHRRRPHRKKRFTKRIKVLQESLGRLHDEVIAGTIATADSWLAAPNRTPRSKRRLVRDADRAIRRLRKAGPYWS